MSHTTRTTRLTLPNGLTLLVGENHANPTIALQGLVKAGALYDNADAALPGARSGLARFTASLLDQGTETRDELAIASAIEDIGASLHFDGGAETVSIRASMLS